MGIRRLRVRVGVVGCGRLAQTIHLPALRRIADVVALADPDPAALAAASGGTELLYACARELVAGNGVDAVVVASPSGQHAADALVVLEAGRRLYLEKPMCATLEDAHAIVAADPHRLTTVGFNRRRHPVVRVAADLLGRAGLGRVLEAETSFCESRLSPRAMPAWKRSRAQGGGVVLDLATHHVDLLRHLLSDEVVEVEGVCRSLDAEHDDADLRLRFTGGAEAVVVASYHRPRADTVVLRCERGSLVLDRLSGTVRMNGRLVRDRRLLPQLLRRIVRSEVDPSYGAALRAFVGGEPGPTVVDGLRVMEVVARAEWGA